MPDFIRQWHQAAVPPRAEVLQQAGYPGWLSVLLARRGVEDAAGAEAFLHPDLAQLHDPLLLAGIGPAVDRLLLARERGEPVALVGDYDVDGVSGTAILTAVGRACGLEIHPILPHRMREGYGFQPVHVQRACDSGCGVVVTIDCGAASIEAAQAALDAGLDVVVTDHHLPGEHALPPGVMQINPQQDHCRYPFSDLSGAGLALKLALALAAACERKVSLPALTRIACLGTIADLVPLRGENRVIAAVGLAELPRTRSVGLRALIQVAGLKSPFSAADVGFRLGPRLNAPGRLDSADQALELLLSRDARRAHRIASDLDGWNRQRQDWERRVAEEARERFLALAELPAILVGCSSSWHRGVVGIAAGRLAKEFNRPVLLAEKDGLATGSGRSIAGIHLHRFFSTWKDEYERFGGHAQAIGMTVRSERFDELRRRWEEAAEAWREQIRFKRLEYELEFTPRQLTPEITRQLQQLEPHGQQNPAPLIRLHGPLQLVRAPRLFGRGHLAAEVTGRDGGRVRLLGWNWGNKVEALQGEFEVVGRLEPDRYTGGTVMRLIDSRPYRAAEDAERGAAAETEDRTPSAETLNRTTAEKAVAKETVSHQAPESV